MQSTGARGTPEPRWPAVVALLCVVGLYAAQPSVLSLGPPWLMPPLVVALEALAVFFYRRGHHRMNRRIGLFVAAVVTAFMVGSLAFLVRELVLHRLVPLTVLRAAASLWSTNVLVFALWYWHLDAGGPHARDEIRGHSHGDFLFPQMALDAEARQRLRTEDWSPNFVDYLFLAFNTSTALSPADTAALSRWAKLLMMTQATISLTIIVMLAGRAVNIL